VPIWWYEFDDPDAPQIILPPVSYPYGANHGSELQYLFDVRKPIPGALTAPQQQLSDAMVLHWSSFVRFGNRSTAAHMRGGWALATQVRCAVSAA
jgi:para-nitrobenzyl esterase